LHKGASDNYLELCKDPNIQNIIKEKIIDKENYTVVVPTYGGPSYGEPYRLRGEGPYGCPDLIGVL
jgi:hypothetical protein